MGDLLCSNPATGAKLVKRAIKTTTLRALASGSFSGPHMSQKESYQRKLSRKREKPTTSSRWAAGSHAPVVARPPRVLGDKGRNTCLRGFLL